MNGQCRICLHHIDCRFNLEDKIRNRFIWEALNSLAKVTITIGDPFPQSICVTCFNRLDYALQFQVEVEKSDKTLHGNDIE